MAFRFSIPLPHFSSKKGKHENKHLKFNPILPHRRGREHPKDSPVCLPTTSSNVRSPRVKVKWSMYGFFARGSVRPTSLVPGPAKKNARASARIDLASALLKRRKHRRQTQIIHHGLSAGGRRLVSPLGRVPCKKRTPCKDGGKGGFPRFGQGWEGKKKGKRKISEERESRCGTCLGGAP